MRSLALAALVGCAPHVYWSGHTEDRRHVVEVIDDAGHTYLVVDGYRDRAYEAIASASVVSHGDHVAFAARRGAKWFVVADRRDSAPWDGIGELVYGPTGRLAYVAERAGGWYVVIDGAVGPRFDAIHTHTLAFSRDGRRLAYAADVGGHMRVVVDGRPDQAVDAVVGLVFSDDNAHVAYAARVGGQWRVVVDGERGEPWSAIGAIVASARGGHLAYSAFDGTAWHVVVDGDPGPSVEAVRRIVWRDDGAHVAWLARYDPSDVLALDGRPIEVAPHVRDAAFAFEPGGALAYVSPAPPGERVVVGDARGPIYDEIGALAFSRDGRLAYTARRGRDWVVVSDGVEHPGGSHVGDLVWSSTGRLGFVARRGRRAVAVVDDHPYAFDLAFEDTLAFCADGSHWSVVAGDLRSETLFFAIDGIRQVGLHSVEIYSVGGVSAALDPTMLQTWSRAEAERARSDTTSTTCVDRSVVRSSDRCVRASRQSGPLRMRHDEDQRSTRVRARDP